MAPVVPSKKIKIKLPTKRIEVDYGTKCEFRQNASRVDENRFCILKEKSSVPVSNKRGPQCSIESQKVKRQKMDRKVSVQCATILKSLMSQTSSWVFNNPVDPVALNIPDYFSIISQPMDLGTINSKLNKNIYLSIEEFAADVRLTFSNAMTYNPPSNDVHLMAKDLNKLFERKWKDLEKNWKCGDEHEKSMTKTFGDTVRKVCNEMHPLQKGTLPKNLRGPEPKRNQKITSLAGSDAKVDILKPSKLPCRAIQQNLHKGKANHDGPHPSGSVKAGLSSTLVTRKCTICGNVSCSCEIPSDSTHASSDISSERSAGRDLNANVAAMLKSCFADDILKAQQKTLFEHVVKSGPPKMRLVKEKMEGIQHEAERARIEAQIKSAEVAARMTAEEEYKKQREREREAARIALQKMERSVEIDDNWQCLKEFEILCGCMLLPSQDLSTKNGNNKRVGDTVKNDCNEMHRPFKKLRAPEPKRNQKIRSLAERDAKVEILKSSKLPCRAIREKLHKGKANHDGHHPSGSVKAGLSSTLVTHKCTICGNLSCSCKIPIDPTHASSDISSEISGGRNLNANVADSLRQPYCKGHLQRKSDLDSDGAVSSLDSENLCFSSQLATVATDATYGEVRSTPGFGVQLSPRKALRAAMLKSRFADTILKAQQKTLFEHVVKSGPPKMRLVKEKMEGIQHEERARIEAQIKSAEVAARMKAEKEYKKQREREREAARVALLKMERSVWINNDLQCLKELAILCGCALLPFQGLTTKTGYKVAIDTSDKSPLEKLGLFLKDEYVTEEEDEEVLDCLEEGEILE